MAQSLPTPMVNHSRLPDGLNYFGCSRPWHRQTPSCDDRPQKCDVDNHFQDPSSMTSRLIPAALVYKETDDGG
jgi:hypothetical protein